MCLKFFLLAGESSGDAHGAALIKELKIRAPSAQFYGVGGPQMILQGLASLYSMDELSLMGFSDVLLHLPKIFGLLKQTVDAIDAYNPDALILIDYPGFNLKVAKSARKRGFKGKIIQYISPAVWAWGAYRVKAMNKTLDLLLTIYPFEKDHFIHSPFKTVYVGNPVAESASHKHTEGIDESLPKDKKIIAIFPGSRKKEIQRNLVAQIEAAELLSKDDPNSQIVLSLSNPLHKPLFETYRYPIVERDKKQALMQKASFAFATSGTVTLELLLNRVPTLVSYDVAPINYLIAKFFIRPKLPYFCIANILLKKEVFPEVYKKNIEGSTLYEKAVSFYGKKEKINGIKQAQKSLLDYLGDKKASLVAAETILELVS